MKPLMHCFWPPASICKAHNSLPCLLTGQNNGPVINAPIHWNNDGNNDTKHRQLLDVDNSSTIPLRRLC